MFGILLVEIQYLCNVRYGHKMTNVGNSNSCKAENERLSVSPTYDLSSIIVYT